MDSHGGSRFQAHGWKMLLEKWDTCASPFLLPLFSILNLIYVWLKGLRGCEWAMTTEKCCPVVWNYMYALLLLI